MSRVKQITHERTSHLRDVAAKMTTLLRIAFTITIKACFSVSQQINSPSALIDSLQIISTQPVKLRRSDTTYLVTTPRCRVSGSACVSLKSHLLYKGVSIETEKVPHLARGLQLPRFTTGAEMMLVAGGILRAAALHSGMMSSQTGGAGVCARRRSTQIDYFQSRVIQRAER